MNINGIGTSLSQKAGKEGNKKMSTLEAIANKLLAKKVNDDAVIEKFDREKEESDTHNTTIDAIKEKFQNICSRIKESTNESTQGSDICTETELHKLYSKNVFTCYVRVKRLSLGEITLYGHKNQVHIVPELNKQDYVKDVGFKGQFDSKEDRELYVVSDDEPENERFAGKKLSLGSMNYQNYASRHDDDIEIALDIITNPGNTISDSKGANEKKNDSLRMLSMKDGEFSYLAKKYAKDIFSSYVKLDVLELSYISKLLNNSPSQNVSNAKSKNKTDKFEVVHESVNKNSQQSKLTESLNSNKEMSNLAPQSQSSKASMNYFDQGIYDEVDYNTSVYDSVKQRRRNKQIVPLKVVDDSPKRKVTENTVMKKKIDDCNKESPSLSRYYTIFDKSWENDSRVTQPIINMKRFKNFISSLCDNDGYVLPSNKKIKTKELEIVDDVLENEKKQGSKYNNNESEDVCVIDDNIEKEKSASISKAISGINQLGSFLSSTQTSLNLSSRSLGSSFSSRYFPLINQSTQFNVRSNLESNLNLESPRSYLSSNLLQGNQTSLYNFSNGLTGSSIRRNLQSVLNLETSRPPLSSLHVNYGNNYTTNSISSLTNNLTKNLSVPSLRNNLSNNVLDKWLKNGNATLKEIGQGSNQIANCARYQDPHQDEICIF